MLPTLCTLTHRTQDVPSRQVARSTNHLRNVSPLIVCSLFVLVPQANWCNVAFFKTQKPVSDTDKRHLHAVILSLGTVDNNYIQLASQLYDMNY